MGCGVVFNCLLSHHNINEHENELYCIEPDFVEGNYSNVINTKITFLRHILKLCFCSCCHSSEILKWRISCREFDVKMSFHWSKTKMKQDLQTTKPPTTKTLPNNANANKQSTLFEAKLHKKKLRVFTNLSRCSNQASHNFSNLL